MMSTAASQAPTAVLALQPVPVSSPVQPSTVGMISALLAALSGDGPFHLVEQGDELVIVEKLAS